MSVKELLECIDKKIDYADIIFKDDSCDETYIYIRVDGEKESFGCCTVDKFRVENHTVFIKVKESKYEAIYKSLKNVQDELTTLIQNFRLNEYKGDEEIYKAAAENQNTVMNAFRPIFALIESLDTSGDGI